MDYLEGVPFFKGHLLKPHGIVGPAAERLMVNAQIFLMRYKIN